MFSTHSTLFILNFNCQYFLIFDHFEVANRCQRWPITVPITIYNNNNNNNNNNSNNLFVIILRQREIVEVEIPCIKSPSVLFIKYLKRPSSELPNQIRCTLNHSHAINYRIIDRSAWVKLHTFPQSYKEYWMLNEFPTIIGIWSASENMYLHIIIILILIIWLIIPNYYNIFYLDINLLLLCIIRLGNYNLIINGWSSNSIYSIYSNPGLSIAGRLLWTTKLRQDRE